MKRFSDFVEPLSNLRYFLEKEFGKVKLHLLQRDVEEWIRRKVGLEDSKRQHELVIVQVNAVGRVIKIYIRQSQDVLLLYELNDT